MEGSWPEETLLFTRAILSHNIAVGREPTSWSLLQLSIFLKKKKQTCFPGFSYTYTYICVYIYIYIPVNICVWKYMHRSKDASRGQKRPSGSRGTWSSRRLWKPDLGAGDQTLVL